MVSCERIAESVRTPSFKVGLAFWVFGTCNNFAYVIMLSAANDILSQKGNSSTPTVAPPPNATALVTGHPRRDLDCNMIGTGAILLADILPALLIKMLAPTFIQKISFNVKISFISTMAIVSFLIVGLSQAVWLSLIGVVCASVSSGIGEITFLSLTASYEKSSLRGWSSGTGAAGLLGSLTYLWLTMLVSPRTALFILIGVPLILILWYFLLLPPRAQERYADTSGRPLMEAEPSYAAVSGDSSGSEDYENLTETVDSSRSVQVEPSCFEKLRLIVPMLHLMVPLSLVYFFEYLINQAFMELLFFPKAFIHHKEQYRWYQTIYQLGVFLSRSSLFLFTFRHIWVLAILQCANAILLLLQIIYFFIPSIWIIFFLILYEGLLGGLAYVNTFYFILQLPMPQFAEYRMGVASVGDAMGITIAGAVSVPLHNILCANF